MNLVHKRAPTAKRESSSQDVDSAPLHTGLIGGQQAPATLPTA